MRKQHQDPNLFLFRNSFPTIHTLSESYLSRENYPKCVFLFWWHRRCCKAIRRKLSARRALPFPLPESMLPANRANPNEPLFELQPYQFPFRKHWLKQSRVFHPISSGLAGHLWSRFSVRHENSQLKFLSNSENQLLLWFSCDYGHKLPTFPEHYSLFSADSRPCFPPFAPHKPD